MWPTYPLFDTWIVFLVTGARGRNHRKQSMRQLGSARVVIDLFVGHMKTICRESFARPGSVGGSAESQVVPSQRNRKTKIFWHLVNSLLCLFLLIGSGFSSNHPAITGQNANCALCHSDMTQGRSVHSQGELSCVLCHSARTEGNTSEMELTAPRAEICFVCHERSAMQQHVASGLKNGCLDCNDANRSDRVMLLRRSIDVNYAPPSATPSATKHPGSKASRKTPGLTHKQANPAH